MSNVNGAAAIYGINKNHKLAILNGRHGIIVGFDGASLMINLDGADAVTQEQVTEQLGDGYSVDDIAEDERGRTVLVPEQCVVRDEYVAP